MKEIWIPVKGYEGLYEVSSFGRVRSLGNDKTKKTKILSIFSNKYGYFNIMLWKNGKRKCYKVHRLVAEAFIPNWFDYPQVNHIDEDKTNNRVDNLEWCDCKYNNNYGTHNEKIIKSNSKPILQFTKSGGFVREWFSATEVGRNGFQQSCVVRCCRGERQSHKGFIWKYKNSEKKICINTIFNKTNYMVHDFNNSLKTEQSNFSIQDNFYLKHFGHLPHRVDFEKFPGIQRQDIDLHIENRERRVFSISEKFRPDSYGDILFEIYSVYSTEPGWSLTSKADLLAYFLPDTIVLLNMKQMTDILKRNNLKDQICYQEESFRHKTIYIDDNEYFVPVIRANNKGYFSLSIALNTEQLKKIGVRHKVF